MRSMLERLALKIKTFFTRAKRNSELEVEHRRRFTRAGIVSQIRHLWDAHYDPPAMGELLRKYTIRTNKAEDLQRAKGKRDERNALIKRLSDYEGYRRLIVPFLELAETDAYFKLRHPDDRNQGDPAKHISLEEYVGKQNGKLELVEDFRLMVSSGIAELEREKAAQKAEALRKEGQNAPTQ